ncbi:hypothetical protein AALP_AA7G020500 [Arabis alpina]|uniref:TIR domain-containing protein n=1 Tax=Arabis alpina TaxID=50452 RepID=A0A087GFF9_ARAAL|nr:hypothetical protein AALP_AA7G020500 [Arabis alpina]
MASFSLFDHSNCKFDVFVSFRGKDTRHSFTSHLLTSLKGAGINTFSDVKLLPSNDLSSLFERIEQSKISIVVFSEHYAYSTWCLEEIWKIIQCKENRNHKVIPIFYNVKTSDVGEQKGRFGIPFLTPEEIFKEDCHKVGKWKDALKIASDIVGFVLPGNRTESEVVAYITLSIMNMLSACETSGCPGIESRSKELEELLSFDDTNCVRTIGVLGMNGIGKTEIADSVYKRNYSRFDGSCILTKIGKQLKKHTLRDLRDELLCKLLGMDNVEVKGHVRLEDFVSNKKVFIVLDGVTEVKQITYLLGKNSYQKGSRIVITTTDRKLLSRKVDATYEVPRLNDIEAMELFCRKAFSDEQLYPPEEFFDLSMKFLDYSKGNPLALTLLGSVLVGEDKSCWTDRWEKLKETPNKELQKELRTSYDGLDPEQQIVFLDIACFFKSEKVDFVLSILKSDRVIHDAAAALRDLEDKCLLTISNDRLEMHDLMHIMGKGIECESSTQVVGRWRRLWNYKDIRRILEKNKGTKYVRGIFLNMSDVAKINLSPVAFKAMSNLKFLKFHNSHCSQWCNKDHNFQSCNCKELAQFPDELVYLHWQGYPYDNLPSECWKENL